MFTPTPADVTSLLEAHGEATTRRLREILADLDGVPPRLAESMAYSLTAGGKRLRPALVLETFAACGGAAARRPAALAAAAAVELVHTFSLVHDDLPAMDDDALRRGKPTNHVVFGEAMAILAGDAMTLLAFRVLAGVADAGIAIRLTGELAGAAGAEGMVGGQVLDIDGENRPLSLAELRQVHRLKTGALLRCACRMGAIAAAGDAATLESATRYGEQLGLVFQIVDDILDVTSTAARLGKATGKDAGRGKNTYPKLIGLDASRHAADEHARAAIAAIEPLGPAAAGLARLAGFVVQRDY